jgi:glucoamylase
MEKINSLLETSKKVLLNCALENGALVAANPTDPHYPKAAKHYFYVWPRDAAYDCLALDAVGVTGVQENFFTWINERAEDFPESGLLYEKYYINGLQALNRFQPDQGAAVILAIFNHFKGDKDKAKPFIGLIKKLANGLKDNWDRDHFKIITNDLWEERHTFPDLKDNFTYSLAACAKGLRLASEILENDSYEEAAEEMESALKKSVEGKSHYYRSFGLLNDERIDASMFGLIWPFEFLSPEDPLARKTVDEIINRLNKRGGIYRYEHDEYDGWMYKTMHRKKGAGYWPLLNFWLAIVLDKMNEREAALKYYSKVLDDIDPETLLIPEQIFANDIQQSINPLGWSHSMFILATKELGLMKEMHE